MAKRIVVPFVLCVTALVAIGCTNPRAVVQIGPQLSFQQAPATSPGADRILVLSPATEATIEVWNSLRDELGEDFSVVARALDAHSTTADIAAAIDEIKPAAVVLMDNRTVRLFRSYQARRSVEQTPPAIVLMSSYLEDLYMGRLTRSSGVAYELPGIIIFSKLRRLVDAPVRRIGIVHRPLLASYVARQRDLASKEDFEFIARAVPRDASPKDVRRAVSWLARKGKVDAIWILNDNALLYGAAADEGWRPALELANVPVVAGIPPLVNGADALGSFAMVADHAGLGVQAANMIFQLADSDWDIDSVRVEQPVSVKTVVNLGAAKKRFKMKANFRDSVDRVIGDAEEVKR